MWVRNCWRTIRRTAMGTRAQPGGNIGSPPGRPPARRGIPARADVTPPELVEAHRDLDEQAMAALKKESPVIVAVGRWCREGAHDAVAAEHDIERCTGHTAAGRRRLPFS